MESKQPIQNSVAEIGLLELLAKAVLTIKKNIILISVSMLIGSLLGLGYFQFSPKVFKSKMLISSDILTESYSKSLIENLDQLIKEKNTGLLSLKLNLPADQAVKLVGIEIKSALLKPSEAVEAAKVYLSIEVEALDNSIWPQLQNGLVSYLLNNEFVKIRNEQRKKYSSEMIEKINAELRDLENLKMKIAEGSWTSSNKGGMVLLDPSEINQTIIDLNKERVNYQISFEIGNSVQVVDGFTAFDKPVSPKFLKSLVTGASIGLLFVVIVLGVNGILALVKSATENLAKS